MQTEPNDPIDQNEPSSQEQPSESKWDLRHFFLEDGQVATFIGEGNEYASLKMTTQWLNDRFVNVYTDNGGTVMLRTYRIDDDRIVLVQEKPEAYEMETPTEEELLQMPVISTYLQFPLEKGVTFEDWTVIEVGATLETPLQTFNDVYVLEQKSGDWTNRNYYVERYGLIRTEHISIIGEEEYVVTSTIASIQNE